MTDFEDSLKDLETQSGEAAAETDESLKKQLSTLMAATKTDFEKLRPQITDQETYDRLIRVVREATEKNENIAQLVTRVKKLGKGAAGLAKKVATIIKV